MKVVFLIPFFIVSLIPHCVLGQLRFRLRPYFGMGLGIGSQSHIPIFEIENDSDQDYYNYNLASLKKTFFRFQTRLNVVQWGHVSLGYLFWNHSMRYDQDFPQDIIPPNRTFPHSYYFSVHGAVLQLDFYSLPSARIIPYIAGGVGGYYGSFKNFYYWVEDEFDPTAEKVVSQVASYTGTAVFVGAGIILFKYAYLYVGYLDLIKDSLPTRQFIDIIVGVTL
jgi:hypothetical protein